MPRVAGLPPPTRGIRCAYPRGHRGARSTPAHAGNTGRRLDCPAVAWVYPRPRGEYHLISRRADYHEGLPPPTRGILVLAAVHRYEMGSTPAHAGNTVSDIHRGAGAAVYPRPRGEYLNTKPHLQVVCGLPPPTRGIPQRSLRARRGRGSTPAHAGNTAAGRWTSARITVYPRPRGEYTALIAIPHSPPGLPPPTRGIRGSLACLRLPMRSTPAHAGNTAKAAGQGINDSVYPRPRGEYGPVGAGVPSSEGLPPPTRGIRIQ